MEPEVPGIFDSIVTGRREMSRGKVTVEETGTRFCTTLGLYFSFSYSIHSLVSTLAFVLTLDLDSIVSSSILIRLVVQ